MENTQKISSLPLYYLQRFTHQTNQKNIGLAQITNETGTSLVDLESIVKPIELDNDLIEWNEKANNLLTKIIEDARLPKSSSEETSLIREICYSFSAFKNFKEDEDNLLEIKLIHNHAEKPFICGDQPIVFLNPSLESKGQIRPNAPFTTNGLQIIFPISPDFAFLFFDSQIYKVGATAMKTVEVADDALVQRLNLLQVINAENYCFFNEHILDFELETMMRKATRYKNDKKHFFKQRTVETINGPELCVANQKLNFIKEIHEIKKMEELDSMPKRDKYGRYPKLKY